MLGVIENTQLADFALTTMITLSLLCRSQPPNSPWGPTSLPALEPFELDIFTIAQCGSAATSVIHSRAFSSCSTLSVRFLFHKQDHNRRTPCKSLSRNTKTRFKDR